MQEITVQRLDKAALEKMGVFKWPVWEKEVSKFDWSYDSAEKCFFLEGKVTVTCKGGPAVSFGKGDFVTFPKGLDCTWNVLESVRKHYKFE